MFEHGICYHLFSDRYRNLSSISIAIPGLILGLRPTNERRRYFVTTSLIGWAQA